LLDIGLLHAAPASGPSRLVPYQTVRTFAGARAAACEVVAAKLSHAQVRLAATPVADRYDLSAALDFITRAIAEFRSDDALHDLAQTPETLGRLARDISLRLAFVARAYGLITTIYALAARVRDSGLQAGDTEAVALADLARGHAMVMGGRSSEGWPLLAQLAAQADNQARLST